MRILFDQGTPVPLRRHLHPHQVDTAAEKGWSELENGELLSASEGDGYECLITTDQNLQYQQNLDGRKIKIVVLRSTSWPKIQNRIEAIVEVLNKIQIGGYMEVAI